MAANANAAISDWKKIVERLQKDPDVPHENIHSIAAQLLIAACLKDLEDRIKQK